jgi:hypothetical protein
MRPLLWEMPINPKKERRKGPFGSITELTKLARTIFSKTVSITNTPPCGMGRENFGRQAVTTGLVGLRGRIRTARQRPVLSSICLSRYF